MKNISVVNKFVMKISFLIVIEFGDQKFYFCMACPEYEPAWCTCLEYESPLLACVIDM